MRIGGGHSSEFIHDEHPFHSTVASMAENGLYMAMGEGKHIVVVRLGDGSYYIGFGLRLPEYWTREQAALVKYLSPPRPWLLSNGGFSR
jgi:hypothetical protein